MFVDKVTIKLSAGNGGNGYVSFRHEKYIDKGGPDGGDGGNGGNVYAVASNSENTLARFRFDKLVKADDGRNGFKKNKHGKRGSDLEVKLPVGTVITDEYGHIRADLTVVGQKVLIAEGGRGGFGNAHFVSSTRQAPRFSEKGEIGETYDATFELKMIADVGLIGLPNAGKSTLLSVISNAKPEIANYPFTTLTPNLGVTELDKDRSLLIADIPGLIEGASSGKGLGDEFLRHVERTSLLIHCIDSYSNSVASDYKVIRKELLEYSKELAERPEVVVLTKIEGLDDELISMQMKELRRVVPKKLKIYAISASAHIGLNTLLNDVYAMVSKVHSPADDSGSDSIAIIKPNLTDLEWTVEKLEDSRFLLIGRKMERFAMRTDFDSEEGIRRLRDIMRKKGIMHELKRAGAKHGDVVIIGRAQLYSVIY